MFQNKEPSLLGTNDEVTSLNLGQNRPFLAMFRRLRDQILMTVHHNLGHNVLRTHEVFIGVIFVLYKYIYMRMWT